MPWPSAAITWILLMSKSALQQALQLPPDLLQKAMRSLLLSALAGLQSFMDYSNRDPYWRSQPNRFIVLAQEDAAPTGQDKTSLLLSAKADRSGWRTKFCGNLRKRTSISPDRIPAYRQSPGPLLFLHRLRRPPHREQSKGCFGKHRKTVSLFRLWVLIQKLKIPGRR